MTFSLQLRRRFLLSIIRSPSLSCEHPLFPSFTQTQPIHTTKPIRSDGFSITFGSEIDSLLKPAMRHTKGASSDKDKTKKKTTMRGSVRSKGVDSKSGKSAEQQQSAADKTVPVLQNRIVKTAAGLPPSHYTAQPSEQKYSSTHDQMTLEISGDAYDTISESATSYIDASVFDAPMDGTASGIAKKAQTGRAVQDRREPLKKQPTFRGAVSEDTSKRMPRKKLEPWQIQKEALQKKFDGEGWSPRKRLSPDAIEGIRTLHEQDSTRYTTPILSQQFKVSPEAIRRILKSKWRPSPETVEERRGRWARRHDRIWDQKAALGLRPERTKIKEPEGPEAFDEEVRAKQMLGQL